MKLPAPLQKKLLEFLISLPNIQYVNGQQALIVNADIDTELEKQISFYGSPTQFFHALIPILLSYGRNKRGEHSLIAILESAKSFIGNDRKLYCDNIIHDIRDFLTISEVNLSSNESFSSQPQVEGDKQPIVPRKKGSKWFRIDKYQFRKRYCEQVYYDYRVFNTSGLRTQGIYALEFEHVFVELRMAPSHIQQANRNPLALRELVGTHTIWRFLQQLETQNATALAIIGAPGCGKTTLLQHIALNIIQKKQKQYGVKFSLPIFLFLREHTSTIIKRNPPLDELLQSHFSNTARYSSLNPPSGWFADELKKGKCLVLLDGLDEVPYVEQRQQVSKWVDCQIRNYPKARFVLTARPGGYKDAPLEQAHVLEVMAFNAEQASKFVHNWYLANKILAYGKDDPGVRQDVRRGAEDLLLRLREQPSLSELTTNPLLLTMVTMVHNYRNVLPEHRVELYAEICDVLLSHWQKAKNIVDPLTASQKRTVLQPLAAVMMHNRVREISIQEAVNVISQPLKQVGIPSEQAAVFLRDIQDRSGLLLEKESKIWNFAHLTFQEYLCAAHWHEMGEVDRWTLSQRLSFIAESWWHETLRLYAAQAEATTLAESCFLLDDNVAALSLAADIAEEARTLAPHVREKIDIRLTQNLEASDPALRRQAAEICLYRRLKHSFQRIDDHREIDSSLVMCAEYQLFLDDMAEHGQYYHPQHWKKSECLIDAARKPITGVNFEEADAFCKWLSQTKGREYRLPSVEEIKVFPLESKIDAAIWGQDGQLIWLNDQIKVEFRKQLSKIATLPLPSNTFTDIHFRIKPFLPQVATALARVLSADISLKIQRNHNRVEEFAEEISQSFAKEQKIEERVQELRIRIPKLEYALTNPNVGITSSDIRPSIRAKHMISTDKGAYLDVIPAASEEIPAAQQDLAQLENDLANIRKETKKIETLRAKVMTNIPSLEEKQEIYLQQAAQNQESTLLLILFALKQQQDNAFMLIETLANKIMTASRFTDIRKAIKSEDFHIVHDLAHEAFAAHLSESAHRQTDLLIKALAAAHPKTFFEWRYAHHVLIARVAEYAYQGSLTIEDFNSQTQQMILDLYWYHHVIVKQADGKLIAHEGIRLVRDEQGEDLG